MIKNEEIKMCGYDDSLGDFLAKNNFNITNIADVYQGLLSCQVDYSQISETVKRYRETYQTGCIFLLFGDNRKYECYVIHSPLTSNQMRRVIALKAFL